MELIHTSLTNPSPLSLCATIAKMQTQQQSCDQLDHEPRQPSMVERLAYRYDRLSIFFTRPKPYTIICVSSHFHKTPW